MSKLRRRQRAKAAMRFDQLSQGTYQLFLLAQLSLLLVQLSLLRIQLLLQQHEAVSYQLLHHAHPSWLQSRHRAHL